MHFCCHVWAGAPNCYLDMLHKLQKWICSTVVATLAAFLELLGHQIYYFGRCLSELAEPVPLPYSSGRSTRCSDRLHDFSVTLPRSYKDVFANSFFTRTAKLWIPLPAEGFPLNYDSNSFKGRINRHFLYLDLL